LYHTRQDFYMEHFYRIRRQLPPRPWHGVVPLSLLVRVRPGVDLPRYLSKLLFTTHYPCQIILVLPSEGPEIPGLPDADWRRKMNLGVIRVPRGRDDYATAVEACDGDFLVTMDASTTLYNGWLNALVERLDREPRSLPVRLGYQSEPSPWGWVLPRAAALAGDRPWQESLRVSGESDPAVSIIVPVRNKMKLTRQCLASIRDRRPLLSHEIIVVDNASDDGTAEMLQGLSQAGFLTWLRNDPPLPFAASCNRGARAARGRYLLFLNNDTVVFPGWMDELVRAAQLGPDVGAVGAKLLFPDDTIQHAGVAFHHFQIKDTVNPYHIFRSFPRQHPAVNKLREFNCVTGACLLTPRAVFEEAGGFDERYVNCFEDVDYCLHLRSRGYRVLYQPTAELIHFEGQTPGRNDAVHPSRVLLQEKWGDLMLADDHQYLPEEGFSIEENDLGVIFICSIQEIQQWREAIAMLVDLEQWLMALEEIDRMTQVVGSRQVDLQELQGRCMLALGDVNRAELAFKRAERLAPGTPGVRWGLAQVAIAGQKPVEARARLRRLLADFPQDPRREQWSRALEEVSRNERAMLRGKLDLPAAEEAAP
ncbi:MAG: glycosyltransferase, partial [Candidatus Zixiibacteriota bacterium]